ncbi:signal peptidase I [Microbacterium paludicola]|uniref:Signal peptidase I n=1 Tax=Microbacterium paludicola TaxID=300019 RepID=A0A4Y9FSK0_9MICO|nr:signal peptidase I [Microbacterium paludicola]MBF0817094.1 signal peptidase I [Microbacterium paludicola]TFU32225.1 signal peptidase I [Microbacterium paludicola]
MTTTATLISAPAVEGGVAAPAAGSRAARRSARSRGRVRGVVGWLLLALAVVLLWPAQFGGLTGLTVVNGHSMEPVYRTDDLVASFRQTGYAVGDIVSYRVPQGQPGAGGRVIHRIASASDVDGETVYTTQGDNNPQADPWTIRDGDILGRAIVAVPGVGAGLTPEGAPLILALSLGVIVTVLLWGDGGRARARKNSDHRP